eukprot:5352468-Pyramimonas_sp.AAC.1
MWRPSTIFLLARENPQSRLQLPLRAGRWREPLIPLRPRLGQRAHRARPDLWMHVEHRSSDPSDRT